MSAPNDATGRDPVIGLDVGGRVYYCHQTTLMNATGSYFSGRFGQDSMISPRDERFDEYGRSVYFIDRDPDIFEHVLSFLRTNDLPSGLPSFQEDPNLWRGLRVEAEFFGLERLSALLQVTYSCSPEFERDRGVLHWLGTDKGRKNYQNPYSIGAIHVGGWVDDPIDEIAVDELDHYDVYFAAGAPASRAAFVQYRPVPVTEGLLSHPTTKILWCDSSFFVRPAVVDLKDTLLRPTHYSLRYNGCFGMEGPWNFEGSVDGKSWDCLHASRNDGNLLLPFHEERARIVDFLAEMDADKKTEEEKSEFLTDYEERHHRHIWALDPAPTQFYRFVRIVGVPEDAPEGKFCLHGAGMELYGDVYEA